MVLKSSRTSILLLLLQTSLICAQKGISKPNDAYDLYWDEPVTPHSIQTATYEVTKNLMDAEVDPCDDFYEYACGKFDSFNPIPKGDQKINVLTILRKRVKYNLKQSLLEDVDYRNSNESYSSEDMEESRSYNFSNAELKLKNYVKSCMNLEQIEKVGIKPAIQYMETLDGWPLSELDDREEPFDWLNLTAHVNQLDGNFIFSNYVQLDLETQSKFILKLRIGKPYFRDRQIYSMTSEATKNHFYYLYSYLIKSVFKRFGADANTLGTTIKDIIDFEVGYINIYLENLDTLENDTEITIEKLHEISPGFDWQMYYTTLFGIQIQRSDKIFVPCEEYVKKIGEYLTNSKPETIAKYLFFMIAAYMDKMMNAELFETKKRRIKRIQGDRFEQCLRDVEFFMPEALSAFFVRRNFYLDSKKDIEGMIADIKTELYDFINRTEWIDQQHKQLAFNKLDLMTAKVGYQEELLLHENLNEIYDEVEIKSDTFLANTISLTRYYFKIDSDMIGQVYNKSGYGIPPQLVNALYNRRDQGSLTFSAGILNPPFYHYYAPGWLKYGALGCVIGHEMVHAFDSNNMLLDSSANIQDFKNLKVIGKYTARSVCMSNQYSKYKFKETGTNLDGSQTLDENISDNGGMALALDAYRKWLMRNPELAERETIPGLDHSPEQLFFLAHGQVSCEAFSTEAILNSIKYRGHAPYKFRLIGSVSNSDSFSTAYNCPFAAPMNPVRKCKYE